MYAERQDDRYGGRVPPKKRKAKVIILKSILYLTEPVKLFEKWCDLLMFAFAKNNFSCMILIFFKAVHLIRNDVNE